MVRQIGVIVAAVVMFGGQVVATTYPKQATMKDLARVWVGIDPNGYELYRLELNEDGSGVLTSNWRGNKATSAYRVMSTSLSGSKLEMSLVPLDPERATPYLRGQAVPGRLDLEIGERKSEWKRRMYFQPEAALLASLKATSDRADNERSK